GTTNSRISQIVAGAANEGQNHRGNHDPLVPEPEPSGTASHLPASRRAHGLTSGPRSRPAGDLLVDLLVELVDGGGELELLRAQAEVRLLDQDVGQALRHQALLQD